MIDVEQEYEKELTDAVSTVEGLRLRRCNLLQVKAIQRCIDKTRAIPTESEIRLYPGIGRKFCWALLDAGLISEREEQPRFISAEAKSKDCLNSLTERLNASSLKTAYLFKRLEKQLQAHAEIISELGANFAVPAQIAPHGTGNIQIGGSPS